MICPNCHKETEEGVFCENCGADLRGFTEAPVSEEKTEETPAPGKKNEFLFTSPGSFKWPIAISILLIAAAAIGLLAKIDAIVGVALARAKFFSIGNRFEFYWSLLIFPVAGAVLFFLKTKKRPQLTAIPYAVFGVLVLNSCLKNLLSFFTAFGEGYTAGSYFAMFIHVLILLCMAGCAAAFVMNMLVKKPGKLPLFVVLYGVFALLSVLFTMILDVRYFILAIVDSYTARISVPNIIYNLLTWAAALFIHAGCILALLNKSKADKADMEEILPEVEEEEPASSDEYAEAE